jgi:hypothetical protein
MSIEPLRAGAVTHQFKVTLGYFKDADTGRDSVRVDITNISPAPFNRVELAWLCQVPEAATGKLRSFPVPFCMRKGSKANRSARVRSTRSSSRRSGSLN